MIRSSSGQKAISPRVTLWRAPRSRPEPTGTSKWTVSPQVYSQGINVGKSLCERDMLDIAASYGIPLWITENGLADATDTQRSSYLVRHLAVVNKAINDGVDIRGYISWSLLDNLEWILGYGEKFGLYSWDPVTLERTARSTVAVLNQITTTNSIPAELFQQYVKATGSLP